MTIYGVFIIAFIAFALGYMVYVTTKEENIYNDEELFKLLKNN